MAKSSWKFVSSYSVRKYKCGVQAGEQVRLRKRLVVLDHKGEPTGKVNRKGEIWVVLPGSRQDPGVVWLREPNGDPHTWDDDRKDFFEWFEIVRKRAKPRKRVQQRKKAERITTKSTRRLRRA